DQNRPLPTFSILPAIKFRQSSAFNEIQRPIQPFLNLRTRIKQAPGHSLRRPPAQYGERKRPESLSMRSFRETQVAYAPRTVPEAAELYGWRTFKGGVLVTVRHPSQT